MVYNSQKLMQIDSAPEPAAQQQAPPGSGQPWRHEKRKVSLSGLVLLKGPPWSMMLPEIHGAATGQDKSQDSCASMQSVPLPDALVMFLGFAARKREKYTDVSGLCSHLRLC